MINKIIKITLSIIVLISIVIFFTLNAIFNDNYYVDPIEKHENIEHTIIIPENIIGVKNYHIGVSKVKDEYDAEVGFGIRNINDSLIKYLDSKLYDRHHLSKDKLGFITRLTLFSISDKNDVYLKKLNYIVNNMILFYGDKYTIYELIGKYNGVIPNDIYQEITFIWIQNKNYISLIFTLSNSFIHNTNYDNRESDRMSINFNINSKYENDKTLRAISKEKLKTYFVPIN